MNSQRATNTGLVALLVLSIAFGGILMGCGNDSPAPTPTQQKTAVPVPPSATPEATSEKPAENAPQAPQASAGSADAGEQPSSQPDPKAPAEADLLTTIRAASDPFDVYALQQKVSQQPEKNELLTAALEKKWSEVEAANPPQTLIAGLDFIVMKLDPAGERQCEFSVLLKTTADIDTDYQVTIMGRVDPMHESFLSEAARKMKDLKGYEIWSMCEWDYKKSEWTQANDVSKWKAGEYHLLSRTDVCGPVPYDVSISLQTWNNGRWVANVGNTIKLGWYAPIEE